jgi:hypothetical protein
MKKILFFAIFILLIVGAALIFDKNKSMKKDNQGVIKQDDKLIREPAVAGSFYPGDKAALSKMIDGFFEKADLLKIDGSINAIIVPHAGYVYSGQVAAYAYKALVGEKIDTVILIGNSHQEYFDGASVFAKGYFRTPLGDIEIDEDFAKKLMDSSDKIYFKESAHQQEHSLEVQLPFLQKVFSAQSEPASGWKIVPIILGNKSDSVDILINALKNLINEKTLIVVSSDLSHYPKYEDAKYSDNKVIEAILTGKRENLIKTIADLEKQGINNLQTCACGQDAIEVVMGLLGGDEIKLLKYANSGDITGDPPAGEAGKSQVVGYASIVFVAPPTSSELLLEQQQRLLEIAKQAVENYIKKEETIKIQENNKSLNEPLGVFVTLKKNEELRGCIGTFEPETPLYENVIEMAIAAATQDPRFNPVKEDELDDLEYEISVLSPLKKVDSYKDVEIGKHGVQIKKGSRSGVFLPQVATENNWDRDKFLSVLCSQKAGLSSDCWKDPETEIYVFTAQVFSDKDVK